MLRQVAKMAHEDFMEPSKIVAALKDADPVRHRDLNRYTVRRMEKQARERGVITFSYPPAIDRLEKYQQLLKTHFGFLERVVVVETTQNESYESLLIRWSKVAAQSFETQVCKGGPAGGKLIVGISGGQTLNSFANAVSEHRREHVQIHTLGLIGQGRARGLEFDEKDFAHINPIVNATILWNKCGGIQGNLHYATISPYDQWDTKILSNRMDLLKKNESVRAAITAMSHIHIAFVGLGQVQEPTGSDELDSKLSLTQSVDKFLSLGQLKADGIVGDIGYNFFNGQGTVPRGKSWDFFLTPGSLMDPPLGLKFYKNMVEHPEIRVGKPGAGTSARARSQVLGKKKVVVIAGKHKVDAIKAALQGKLFNVWITDELTARHILDWAGERVESFRDADGS
ncbi:MAG TPA: sugar-binding domain-containing protein [Candidatus Sulfotelmatobacter sp.]|nr:sugar-binding domain-containing protein [Candidatus Sulfotelmatobacter sp.]